MKQQWYEPGATVRILEPDEVRGLLPRGWQMETSNGYYCAFFGEEMSTIPCASIVTACVRAWQKAGYSDPTKAELRENSAVQLSIEW
jgi:hypothetical protein